MPVNYIAHLQGFFAQSYGDDRLSPTHISLYLALFQEWNAQRFPSEMQVSRAVLMARSKIRSKTTYSRVLGELADYGYITYQASNNPYVKSSFSLSNKWTTSGPPIAQPSPKYGPPVVEPSPNNGLPLVLNSKQLNIKDINVQTANPALSEVSSYFESQSSTSKAAGAFYDYYSANGWKMGKASIVDWKASARRWIARDHKSNSKQVVQKLDHHHISKTSDYGQQL